MQRLCWALVAMTVGVLASPELFRAQANLPPDSGWLTGPELQRQLSQPCGVTWAGVPFRAAVRQLADTHRVAILIDRRIDPDCSIDLASGDVSLGELLAQIATQRNAEVSLAGAVVYLAPPDAARPIRTVVAQRTDWARGTRRELQSRLLARKPMSWPDRATPHELVIRLADEAGLLLDVDQIERLPHDLWAAADLPPLLWIERLQLVLSQFDLTFEVEVEAGRLRLVPLSQRVSIERRYPATAQPQRTAERLAELAPEAEVVLEGNSVVVRGRLEDHERIASGSRRPAPVAQAPAGEQQFTLRVENLRLAQLIDALNRQQPLPIELDKQRLIEAGISPDELVSVDVRQVSLLELLRAAVEPLGLQVRAEGDRLMVFVP